MKASQGCPAAHKHIKHCNAHPQLDQFGQGEAWLPGLPLFRVRQCGRLSLRGQRLCLEEEVTGWGPDQIGENLCPNGKYFVLIPLVCYF